MGLNGVLVADKKVVMSSSLRMGEACRARRAEKIKNQAYQAHDHRNADPPLMEQHCGEKCPAEAYQNKYPQDNGRTTPSCSSKK
jgi:hypothetical protein